MHIVSSWSEYTSITTAACNHHTLNTQLLYTSTVKVWKLSKIVSYWYRDCPDAVNDGNCLRGLRDSVYHSTVSESLNLETMHFRTYVDTIKTNKKKTPWPESASELYRLRDRRLSAKLVPTFADRGCHIVSVTDPYGRILGFLDRSRYSFF
jgi:hypothetical protein